MNSNAITTTASAAAAQAVTEFLQQRDIEMSYERHAQLAAVQHHHATNTSLSPAYVIPSPNFNAHLAQLNNVATGNAVLVLPSATGTIDTLTAAGMFGLDQKVQLSNALGELQHHQQPASLAMQLNNLNNASLSQQSFLPLSIGQLAAANAAVAQHQSDQDALLTHQRLVNQINHIQAAASNAVAVAAVAAVAQQRQATMESEQQASTVADGQEQKELNRKLSHNEVEKRRRDKITESIMQLAHYLPERYANEQRGNMSQAKSKGIILDRINDYLFELVARNKQLEEQANSSTTQDTVTQLMAEVEQLREENRRLSQLVADRMGTCHQCAKTLTETKRPPTLAAKRAATLGNDRPKLTLVTRAPSASATTTPTTTTMPAAVVHPIRAAVSADRVDSPSRHTPLSRKRAAIAEHAVLVSPPVRTPSAGPMCTPNVIPKITRVEYSLLRNAVAGGTHDESTTTDSISSNSDHEGSLGPYDSLSPMPNDDEH